MCIGSLLMPEAARFGAIWQSLAHPSPVRVVIDGKAVEGHLSTNWEGEQVFVANNGERLQVPRRTVIVFLSRGTTSMFDHWRGLVPMLLASSAAIGGGIWLIVLINLPSARREEGASAR